MAQARDSPVHNTLYLAESAIQTGRRIQRSLRVDSSLISRDGIGLQGLFTASSLGFLLWFDTQNWRRLSQIQMTAADMLRRSILVEIVANSIFKAAKLEGDRGHAKINGFTTGKSMVLTSDFVNIQRM